MTRHSIFIALLAVAPLGAAEKSTPQALLQRAMKPPRLAYQGSMTITQWHGQTTKAENVQVHYYPPRYYRWEFLNPDGSSNRIVESDGTYEQVTLLRQKKILRGAAAQTCSKLMPMNKEWDLLLTNYTLGLAGLDTIAGRPAWALTLTPLVEGKPLQQVWVDKQTGVILAIKRFRPHGELATLSQYTRFDPAVPTVWTSGTNNEHLFTTTEHGYDPDFLTLDDLQKIAGDTPQVVRILPMGFEFESADFFTVKGIPVDHYRYTDGLNVVSIFETAKPVHFKNPTEAAQIVQVESNSRHYIVMGELPKETLQKISATLTDLKP